MAEHMLAGTLATSNDPTRNALWCLGSHHRFIDGLESGLWVRLLYMCHGQKMIFFTLILVAGHQPILVGIYLYTYIYIYIRIYPHRQGSPCLGWMPRLTESHPDLQMLPAGTWIRLSLSILLLIIISLHQLVPSCEYIYIILFGFFHWFSTSVGLLYDPS